MITVRYLKDRIKDTEVKIITNYGTARSNECTLFYFAQLALYKFIGGREDIIDRIKTNGVLDHLQTDKAKSRYLSMAQKYVTIGWLLLLENDCAMKHIDDKVDNQEKANRQIREFIYKILRRKEFSKYTKEQLEALVNKAHGVYSDACTNIINSICETDIDKDEIITAYMDMLETIPMNLA